MAATETVTPSDAPHVDPAGPTERFHFWRSLAIIVAVGLVVRLVYIYWLRQQGSFLIGDSLIYHRESQLIADGLGWIQPQAYDAFGIESQLAMHPPAYPAWLATWSFVGLDSVLAQQLLTVPIGLASITTVGLIGRQVWSPLVGIIAAAIAAFHPSFFSWEGMILQEPMAIFAATLVILAFVRLLRTPDRASIVLAGLAAGFAPLTRAELGVSVAICAIVVLLAHRSWQIVRSMVVVTLIAVLVLTPWATYNTLRFDKFVPISNGFGVTLTTTYCSDLTTNLIGYWSFPCAVRAVETVYGEYLEEHPDAVPLAPGQEVDIEIAGVTLPVDGDRYFEDFNEAEVDSELASYAIEFVKENPGYVVKSIPARLGRVLGVFRPIQQIHLDEVPDGRQRPIAIGAWAGYYLALPFAIAGGVMLWRRSRSSLIVLIAPLLGALTAVTITFGNTRYRAIGEPSIAVVAAIGVAGLVLWLRTTWNASSDAQSDGDDPDDVGSDPDPDVEVGMDAVRSNSSTR